MPSTEDLAYSAYTSPLKLFEYMAAGRPVVSSDLPVLREVLTDERNALLYPSRDPAALAAAVRHARRTARWRGQLTEQALQDVRHYAWEARAQRIIDRLSGLAPDAP